MAMVTGVGKLLRQLKQLANESKKNYTASVTVGFTQGYALPVHEITTWKHKVGQAKYLTIPFNALREEIKSLIVRAIKNGATAEQALLIAGLRVQREAQLLTPVDTGALKASAFTSLTKDADRASEKAHRDAEKLRAKVLAKRERDKTKGKKP